MLKLRVTCWLVASQGYDPYRISEIDPSRFETVRFQYHGSPRGQGGWSRSTRLSFQLHHLPSEKTAISWAEYVTRNPETAPLCVLECVNLELLSRIDRP